MRRKVDSSTKMFSISVAYGEKNMVRSLLGFEGSKQDEVLISAPWIVRCEVQGSKLQTVRRLARGSAGA